MDVEAKFMDEALRQARKAMDAGEVPVGAVVVKDGRVLARAHNQVEALRDATAHAEMLVLTQAAEAVENWRLEGVELYVTLEPCAMCAGAMVNSRLARVVYGADDPVAGACGSVFNVVDDKRLNHRVPVVKGLKAAESSSMLKDFFKSRRSAKG